MKEKNLAIIVTLSVIGLALYGFLTLSRGYGVAYFSNN